MQKMRHTVQVIESSCIVTALGIYGVCTNLNSIYVLPYSSVQAVKQELKRFAQFVSISIHLCAEEAGDARVLFAYTIYNQMRSKTLRGTLTGHSMASSAALPVHKSAVVGSTTLVRLKSFQKAYMTK